MPRTRRKATTAPSTETGALKKVGISSEDTEKKAVRGSTAPLEITKPDGRKLAIISRTTMGYYDADTDRFSDVYIHQVIKNTRTAIVSVAERGRERKGQQSKVEKFTVPVDTLDVPMKPDINTRFDYFSRMAHSTLEGKYPSILILGEGGLGKSHEVEQLIEQMGLEEDTDFVRVKGYMTAPALFAYLQENHNKPVIFDDIDSIFNKSDAANILKAALDSKRVRKITWATARKTEAFNFTGSVIFLSNMRKEDFESPLLSRVLLVDLFMTPEEKMERLRFILPNIDYEGPKLSLAQKNEVMDVLDKFKNSIHNLNARTLLKAMKVYAESGDMSMVRYQIFNA